MKFSVAGFILLFLLSSCSGAIPGGSDRETVQKLEADIRSLQEKVGSLEQENILLKAGGDPSTIQSSFSSKSDTTFTEGNYDSCMKASYSDYISQGTLYCQKSGYSTGDILANKCQLDTALMKELQNNRNKGDEACKNLYK